MNRSSLILAATVLATSGCLDYTIDTTLRADGTGVRLERMELTRNDDFDLSADEVTALTRSGAARGWSRSVEV
ncbi:MAG: hypothetical protein KJP18_02885, partial [Gemmatimonadetes bacterium]|nr:hypothetical protein [Gemmatimonadota bacterium]